MRLVCWQGIGQREVGWTQYGWPSTLALQTRGGLATEEGFRDGPAGPQEGLLLPGVGGDGIFAMTEKGGQASLTTVDFIGL